MVVLGFNKADDKDVVLEFLKENVVTFPNILDTSGAALEVSRKFETLTAVSRVPLTYVIHRDGRVVDAWYGYDKQRALQALERLGIE